MGSLNIYTNVTNTGSLLWTQNGNKGQQWLNGRFSIISAQAFRLSFEAVRGINLQSSIAIDDIDLIEKSCDFYPEDANPNNFVTIATQSTSTRSVRPPSQYDCNFEDDFCIWTASKENTFNWTRVQGIMGNELTGPIESDHTYGSPNGWYVYVDARNKNPTDIARLETFNAFSGLPRCMEFYYYFFGSIKYKFNVYVKLDDQIGFPIWSRENSNADFWRYGRITVTSGNPYKILMEMTGIQFGSINEIFCLDDIFFTNGACKDSSDINGICTFSNDDMCGNTVNSTGNNNFKWTLYTPSRRSIYNIEPRTGPLPIYDHTSEGIGSGYVYAQSRGFRKNDSTSLFTKVYTPFDISNPTDSSRCLEFYFYLQDTDAIELNVVLMTTSSTKNKLWSRNYDHSKFWWKGEVNIKVLTNYSLAFEAIVLNKPENGLAALDDIGLRNGICSR